MYKQNSPGGGVVGGEYVGAFFQPATTPSLVKTSFAPNDAFSLASSVKDPQTNPLQVPPIGQWGYDIPFQEELSSVTRLWMRAQEDLICGGNSPTVFVASAETNANQAIQFGRANNQQFDCRRRLTLYYGRMWAIGQAKCAKIIHDNSRLECIANVKDMVDNNNDNDADGGRIYQDFAVVKPPQVGAVGNVFWGIYVA